MNDWKIYTDGSYKPSKKSGGIGIVWIKNDEKVLEYSKGFKNTTNNIMELKAIYVALKSIRKPIDSLEIISDSEYAIGCVSNPSWNPKKNVELITKIKNQLKEAQKLVNSPIDFRHTYGHSTDKWNNLADSLAQKASNFI